MEQILTLVCKLQPTPEEATHIDATMQAFTEACAYIHATIPARLVNVMRMQAMLYYDVRARFGLSSNLAQQAFRRVSGNRKTAKANKDVVNAFDPTSIQYDQRIFAFVERIWSASLTLLHGRVHFRLPLGNYQRGTLRGRKPTSAQLCRHPDGAYALHIQVKEPIEPPVPPTDVIGVDLGRTDIAHTSDGETWDGTVLRRVRDHFTHMRQVLQHKASKGTRSTRRRCRELLARLSGRERRFQRHTNHGIAKTLVHRAPAAGGAGTRRLDRDTGAYEPAPPTQDRTPSRQQLGVLPAPAVHHVQSRAGGGGGVSGARSLYLANVS